MTKEELTQGFMSYAYADADEGLKLILGLFVGLGEAYTELNNANPDAELTFIGSGEGQRTVTIHPKGYIAPEEVEDDS